MTDIKELADREQTLKTELARLSQNPARVHRLSEEARTEAVLALEDELRLVRQEIEAAATARNERLIGQVYGGAPAGAPPTEDAVKELRLAQEALDKSLSQFESQTKGYLRKIRQGQLDVFNATANAGQTVRRPDLAMSALATRLSRMVEDTVRHG